MARTGFSSSQPVGQSGAGTARDKSNAWHASAVRSVASHPGTRAPILAAVHPELLERHSQIRSCDASLLIVGIQVLCCAPQSPKCSLPVGVCSSSWIEAWMEITNSGSTVDHRSGSARHGLRQVPLIDADVYCGHETSGHPMASSPRSPWGLDNRSSTRGGRSVLFQVGANTSADARFARDAGQYHVNQVLEEMQQVSGYTVSALGRPLRKTPCRDQVTRA